MGVGAMLLLGHSKTLITRQSTIPHTGLKRVTLVKDPDKGIGCTIKNAAGHIFVNRIIEDGPIAHTGVLRPGWCSAVH